MQLLLQVTMTKRKLPLQCKKTNSTRRINSELIHESPEEKLLRIILDKTLSFKACVTSLF